MTNYSYTVTYDPAGDITGTVDITDYIQFIKIKESGTGEIRSAFLTLNSTEGAFITDINGGATPLINEYDLIKISVTDEDSVTFTQNYEVIKTKPVDTVQRGTVLDVELLGPEHHLMRFPFARQSKRRDQADSAFVVSQDIIKIYNDTKGSTQPSISEHTITTSNTLPRYTANHYPFSVSQMSVYDGLKYVHDRVGSSVAAGGGGDFWEFGFRRNVGNERDLKFFSVISGSTNSGVTLADSVDVNPGEEESGIESTLATIHATWGADGFGTFPTEISKFRDALTAWRAMPDYVSGATYPVDSIVRRRNTGPDTQGDELHFKANKNTSIAPPTSQTNNADWNSYTFGSFITLEVPLSGVYSPWTNASASEWRNSGANPSGTMSNDPPVAGSIHSWDMNQVVYDGTFFRTWVVCKATSPAGIPSQYLYSGTSPYRGLRVLVNGTGSGAFSGFNNDIMEYDDDNDEWRLFRTPSDNEFVCVDAEAKVYKLISGTWTDVSTQNEANDAYHPVYSISSVAGHMNKLLPGGAGTFGDNSAVQYEYRYSQNDITSLSSRTYYRAGACINWRTPFPHNSYNSLTIGQNFGSSATIREPVTLDTNNMEYSPNGSRGFNQANAETLGPLDGIRFMTKFKWSYKKDGTGNLIRAGNIACRCYMYDIHDNVVIADFTISHNDNWEEISIPFSSFNEYRARIPWSLENSGSNVFLQELEILQRFDYTNIVKIGLQWMAPYDDQGRYTLLFNAFGVLFPNIEDIIAGLFNDGFNIKWAIDAFHFTKPLLAVSDPITSGRAMFTDFDEEPMIFNHYQLEQANLAKLEQNRFRHKKFEVHTEGRFNIELFESFKINNDRIIIDAHGASNTVELVAKEIEYTIDKPAAGIGGFMRKITGVARLT